MDVEMKKPRAWERVLCFDERSGVLLWTHSYEVTYPENCFTLGQENGPGSTPLMHGDKIFSLGECGDAYCLNASSGEILWHRNLSKDYQTKSFTTKASPLIEDDLLILVIGGKPDACVLALDKETGKEIWHALDEDSDNSSPIIVTTAKRRQLIVWTQQSVSSLNSKTGEILWRERLLTSSDNAVATPVSDGKLLLISGLMFKLDENGGGATVLWPDTRAVSHRILSNTSTAMMRDDHVYSAKSTGELVCLDALTGKRMWSTDQVTTLKSGASIHLTANLGTVLLYNDQGELIRARLSPEGYEEISRTLLLAPDQPFGGHKLNWAPPSYAMGKVFVRNQHELVCASLGK